MFFIPVLISDMTAAASSATATSVLTAAAIVSGAAYGVSRLTTKYSSRFDEGDYEWFKKIAQEQVTTDAALIRKAFKDIIYPPKMTEKAVFSVLKIKKEYNVHY